MFDILLCVFQRYLFAAIGTGFCVFDVSPGRERLLVRKLEAHYSKISHLGLASEGYVTSSPALVEVRSVLDKATAAFSALS